MLRFDRAADDPDRWMPLDFFSRRGVGDRDPTGEALREPGALRRCRSLRRSRRRLPGVVVIVGVGGIRT